MLVFIYVYRIDINIERLISCSNKQQQGTKYFQVQATQYDQLSLQVQWSVQSALQLSLSCLLLMPLTESFFIYLC